MSEMNVENRQYVRNPRLKYTSIEIMPDASPPQFHVYASTSFSFAELQEFSKLINRVLEMEVRRLSQQDESDEPAAVPEASETEVTA